MDLVLAAVLGTALGFLVAVRRRPQVVVPSDPVDESRAAGDELAQAVRDSLTSVQLGIVVFDSGGNVVYRNASAEFPAFSRHAVAVINGEIHDLIGASTGGDGSERLERELVLYGPPRAVLTMRVLPRVGEESVGGVIVIDDLTSARRLDEVRQSFVANVSHELRTPVGAIVVLAETLCATTDPVTVSRLSGRLATAANRLGHMIEDLLELSRTEQVDTMDTESLGIAEVIDEAVANLEESARSKQVKIRTTVEPETLSLVGDRRQLRSAVQNLLDNAIKYSDTGGEVRVQAGLRGERVVLSVADDGIGIPEPDLDRIYERFYRVDAARRRQTGGTGLGLSIVRHVAMNHNGDISVRSAEGEGSTFSIELPFNELHRPSEIAPAPVEGETVG